MTKHHEPFHGCRFGYLPCKACEEKKQIAEAFPPPRPGESLDAYLTRTAKPVAPDPRYD